MEEAEGEGWRRIIIARDAFNFDEFCPSFSRGFASQLSTANGLSTSRSKLTVLFTNSSLDDPIGKFFQKSSPEFIPIKLCLPNAKLISFSFPGQCVCVFPIWVSLSNLGLSAQIGNYVELHRQPAAC